VKEHGSQESRSCVVCRFGAVHRTGRPRVSAFWAPSFSSLDDAPIEERQIF
jgi:hypothetical protein